MTSTAATRLVHFADLRGSTLLYERVGNAQATAVVTHSINLVGQVVQARLGRVVKTLGDGLMAVFDDVDAAMQAADEMHDCVLRIDLDARDGPPLRLKVGMAWGEMVDVGGDCFGDAVNVAARLLDISGDNETLCTEAAARRASLGLRERLRSLELMHLRGRQEPVRVFRLEPAAFSDSMSTVLDVPQALSQPDRIRLQWRGEGHLYESPQMPIVLGRSQQADLYLDDTRVSRSHARIDWQSGNFQLTDMSSNGTFVRFRGQVEPLSLRRTTCTLHGNGVIWLGAAPDTRGPRGEPPQLLFEILRVSDAALYGTL